MDQLGNSGTLPVEFQDLGVVEPFVRQALADLVARIQTHISSQASRLQQPRFSVRLESLHPGGYSALLYLKQTGRRESHILELVALPGGKAIANHRFWLQDDPGSCRKAAEAFREEAERGWQKWASRH